ncbi:hypothetical protein AAVH_11290 [Aphelenchoides avenae]|nr:hypothetical protein AAVH_11290 [Aphelenchus avenae]
MSRRNSSSDDYAHDNNTFYDNHYGDYGCLHKYTDHYDVDDSFFAVHDAVDAEHDYGCHNVGRFRHS